MIDFTLCQHFVDQRFPLTESTMQPQTHCGLERSYTFKETYFPKRHSFIYYIKMTIDGVCGLMMVWRSSLSESSRRKLGAHATSSDFSSEKEQISKAGV